VKALLFSLLFFVSVARAQSPWTELRTESVMAPPVTAGIQQISLQLVVDEGSEWARPGELEAQIKKASGIFKKCGVELGKADIKIVRYTPAALTALNNPNPYKGPSELVLMNGDLSKVRPAVFLFGNQIASTAKAFNTTSISRLSMGSPVDVRPLLNTTLLSGHHRTNTPIPGAHDSYSTLAHELAHLFGDLDHVDLPGNLMSSRREPNSKTSGLTNEQCEKIRQHSLVQFSGLNQKDDDCE
jgi:hypothetical protein